jgi:putative tryptophan/tyrosine transport system ATP-binding protein
MPGYPVICKSVVYSPPEQPDLKILDGTELQVAEGEFLGIVGGNGTGKSTLLQAIAGEIELTSGLITVSGQRIIEPIHNRIDGVGIVHQNDDDDLLHAYSVLTNAAFRQANNGCHPNRFWACGSRYHTSIAAKLGSLGLHADVDTLVGHLSGGMRQTLNIVIAVHLEHVRNPCCLLLLDEHTSKLDHKHSHEVMEFTNTQVRKTGTTAIMVTHRYIDAIQYCDRIVVMGAGGRIAAHYKRGKVSIEELAKAVEEAA